MSSKNCAIQLLVAYIELHVINNIHGKSPTDEKGT